MGVLPSQHFKSTQIPGCLWLLAKYKHGGDLTREGRTTASQHCGGDSRDFTFHLYWPEKCRSEDNQLVELLSRRVAWKLFEKIHRPIASTECPARTNSISSTSSARRRRRARPGDFSRRGTGAGLPPCFRSACPSRGQRPQSGRDGQPCYRSRGDGTHCGVTNCFPTATFTQ